MAKQSKTLQLMALKLGLINDEKVISKAAEFERLLLMKSSISSITDTAKAVICLDLAATSFRVSLDVKTAIKCSGLKTPSYTNSRKIIENQLDLNSDKVTVSGLCLTLQCNVQELADRILEEYRRTAKMEVDLNMPQYACMAVYQACRINKVKVSKSKLIDKAQLKSAQWAKLDTEWTKFTDGKFTATVKKKRGKLAKSELDTEAMEVDHEIAKKEDQCLESEIEPYDDWKRRILEESYKELKQLKTDKQNTLTKQKTDRSLNKQMENPRKQIQNLSKQIQSPSKQIQSPNKRIQSPNKRIQNPSNHMEVDEEMDSIKSKTRNVVLTYSPRRSPRKTPKKFEPYKSPVKDKGVRLLFPL